MAYELDPEIAALVGAAPSRGLGGGTVTRGDWLALREAGELGLALMEAILPERDDVLRSDHMAKSFDGAEILLRWYEPKAERSSSAAVVYLHGGGMIMGTMQQYDRFVAGYVAETGVPFLSIDYRRAGEHPHPTPVEDCYAGLTWLVQHAAEFGVDSTRIAVMGDSAGGGLAAGVALLARDRDVQLARQILVYPMLDDRTTQPVPELVPFAMWSYEDNYTGWHALLGDALGTEAVPASAAPARASDVSRLAPAYIDVGQLDIFCDESMTYAHRISRTGTAVELHVYPGCPHGYDRFPRVSFAARAFADRHRVVRSL